MHDNEDQTLHLYSCTAGVIGRAAAASEMLLRDGRICSGHMKGPALAQEEVQPNSTGYYYRRLLKPEPKEHTDCFLTAQAGTRTKRHPLDICGKPVGKSPLGRKWSNRERLQMYM